MPRIPINLATGKLKPSNLIAGIDLGTTNSLIAHMQDGQPEAIADFDKDVIVPSLVYFPPGGEPIVGETAREHLLTEPERTIYSAKRLMGKSYGDLEERSAKFPYKIIDAGDDQLVKVQVEGKTYTPIELSSLILRELKHRAEHRLKTEVRQVVITVPAYFNDAQRQATRDAGKLAGLDVLRIVNEPTAAALAYGLGVNPKQAQTIAVYDLGGGTFDVTLLRLEGGVFEVLATHGDTYLGGDDFDHAVVEHWKNELGLADNLLAQDAELAQQIRLLAERAKKELGAQEQFSGELHSNSGQTWSVQLSREQFNQLIAPYLQRTLEACSAALKDAELTPQAIDQVVLVGGSTRSPAVKQAVEQLFGKTPLDHLDPDQVVALGAAVQADILAGNRKDLLLLDVTPLSLGIETAGGLMDVLISRNSKVPNQAARQYTTQVDGQTQMRIAVYQGERELVQHNRKLAEFELTGIPAMPAGLPKVEIRFTLDADGILQVGATELRSGVQQEVQVKPQYGLTDQEVEQMLLDSLTHAETDVETRMLKEAQEEGRQLVYQATRYLEKHQAYFSAEEAEGTRQRIADLERQVQEGDKNAIQNAITALDEYTAPVAHRVMDAAVGEAMRGQQIGE